MPSQPHRNTYPKATIVLKRAILGAGLVSLLSNSVVAHEYWILADDYTPQVGQVVALKTEVGEDFIGDDVPNIEDFYADYSVLSQSGRTPVQGSLATTPPAYIRIDAPGTYIVGQRTTRTATELDAEAFVTYLDKQGLEHIIPLIKQRYLHNKVAREDFSRAAKAIIQTPTLDSNTDNLALLSQALGYTYEIIPLSDPLKLDAGDTFKIKINYDGTPQGNAEILALNKQHPEEALRQRTNEQGIAEIPLNRAGIWQFSSVHMIAVDRYDIEWESFWANLSFEID